MESTQNLQGKKIAALMTEGFEQVEFTEPKKALQDAGATVHLIAPKGGSVKAWDETEWGETFDADLPLAGADPSQYDALLLPGGVMNPDNLRTEQQAIKFIQHFFEQQKPVAAICHAPTLLVEADVVDGLTLTSFPSIKTDLRNAGADWVDQEVVVDGNLVTSRNPNDIPAFNRETIKLISEGVKEKQSA
ncbi:MULTISPECIES: type 1 glutamine amidotransferase domain-containing protein [Spirosoma]|uniref:Type 1 glutamine amidotransferase n=1 Tax=Spirosoma liriopis TaxID=2937440 RepID=A0ABT0HDT3_9BACT|nr:MULTISPECIES: type 1 glutamine amidotransferase domain-containing protein [Spirosoma]MCK8490322.1 type 1 glutamine amidotransferase [Spirosoma liriopis]UHG89697.1 type 1 glutamine amidotransferase [Spirosoma oryzicola]